MMTIVIHFHQAHYRNFKHYYTEHVQKHLRCEFPHLLSYARFIQRLPSILQPLCAFLQRCLGRCSGIGFIDSTALAVRDNRHIAVVYPRSECSFRLAHGGCFDERPCQLIPDVFEPLLLKAGRAKRLDYQ